MRVESFVTHKVGIINEIVMMLEVKFYQCAECGKVYRLSQQATGHYMKNHQEKKNGN